MTNDNNKRNEFDLGFIFKEKRNENQKPFGKEFTKKYLLSIESIKLPFDPFTNIFAVLLDNPILPHREKVRLAAQTLAYNPAKTGLENQNILDEFNAYRDHVDAQRRQVARELIELTDPATFKELAGKFTQASGALTAFNDALKPFQEALETAKTAGTKAPLISRAVETRLIEAARELKDVIQTQTTDVADRHLEIAKRLEAVASATFNLRQTYDTLEAVSTQATLITRETQRRLMEEFNRRAAVTGTITVMSAKAAGELTGQYGTINEIRLDSKHRAEDARDLAREGTAAIGTGLGLTLIAFKTAAAPRKKGAQVKTTPATRRKAAPAQ